MSTSKDSQALGFLEAGVRQALREEVERLRGVNAHLVGLLERWVEYLDGEDVSDLFSDTEDALR